MNRILLLLLAGLVSVSDALAGTLALEKTQRVALNWMVERSNYSTGGFQVKESFPISENGVVVCHVFNIVPAGFVVVSADDVGYPVIAYAFEGTFQESILSPDFSAMMENAQMELGGAIQNKIAPASKTVQEWARISVATSSIQQNAVLKVSARDLSLTTKWSQGDPYNRLCPIVDKGLLTTTRCPTGCVATAMAQIMKYHNYPTTGVGKHSYVEPETKDEKTGDVTYPSQGTLSADFGATTYNWAKMPNELSGLWLIGSSNEQITAVSTLMYHCGVGVDMDYSPDGSGSYLTLSRDVFVQHFDYALDATWIRRDKYMTSAQWVALMEDEIDEGRAVLYCGTDKEGGHAFVMDGYQAQGYFRFNWGWGGKPSYFYLDAITPSSYDFTTNQGAVIRIRPEHTGMAENSAVLWINQTKWEAPKDGGITDPTYVWNSNPLSTIDIQYTLASDVPWLTMSSSAGTSNRYETSSGSTIYHTSASGYFTVSAERNTTGAARIGKVTVMATTAGVYGGTKVLTVTQPSSTANQSVDVALVIDRSGSMNTSNYLTPAKSAASTFVGLMQTNDNIAIVSFDTYAVVNFPLTLITAEATKTNARNAISAISSGGNTSIGAGMQSAQAQLDKGRIAMQQAMILLSDGYSNTSPWVKVVLPTIPDRTDIFTIALGAASDADTLNLIASRTGGRYYFSPDATKLQDIYHLLRGTISNQQTIASFSGTVAQGSSVVHSAPVDPSSSYASISVAFQTGSLTLALISPSGRQINSSTAVSDSTITYSTGGTYVSYGIRQPEPGTWQLLIVDTGTGTSTAYTASVQVASEISITPFVDQQDFERGQPILVSCILRTGKEPLTNATVSALVQRPGSSMSAYRGGLAIGLASDGPTIGRPKVESFIFASDSIRLYDDGLHNDGAASDGLYSSLYTNTASDGSYTFELVADGQLPSGNKFRRVTSLSTVVRASTRPYVPVLKSPLNGVQSNNPAAFLSWTRADTGSSIELQVSYIVQSALSQTKVTMIDTLVKSDSLWVQGLIGNRTYLWRVRAVSAAQQYSEWSSEWSFTTSLGFSGQAICYPNPFDPAVTTARFKYRLERSGNVTVRLYDVANRLVREILGGDQYIGATMGIADWNGRNESGDIVANGVYFYIIESSSGERAVGKIAVLR
jgi:Mg-chelatase subunit ChlD